MWKKLLLPILLLIATPSWAGFWSDFPGVGAGTVLNDVIIDNSTINSSTLNQPIINDPTFNGTLTFNPGTVVNYDPSTIINGPNGSVWNNNGIFNLKNLTIAAGGSITIPPTGILNLPDGSVWNSSGLSDLNLQAGGAITVGGVPAGGACPANQYYIALSSSLVPTCAPITYIPGPVTINQATFTGNTVMPDGTTWSIAGINKTTALTIAASINQTGNLSVSGTVSTGALNTPEVTITGPGGNWTFGYNGTSTAQINWPPNGANFITQVTPNQYVIATGANGTPFAILMGPPQRVELGANWALRVVGGITEPASALPGSFYYNQTGNFMEYWNGTSWITMAGLTGGACAAGDFVNSINSAGVITCGTPSGGGGTLPTPVSIGNGGLGQGVAPSAGQILVASGPTAYNPVTMTGAITISPTGVTALTAGSIGDAALANAYSGVGACATGLLVRALNRNAAPTCAPPITVSTTAPATPSDGMLWFNPTDLQTYIRYNDGTSTQWIALVNLTSGGAFLPLAGGTMTGPLTTAAISTSGLLSVNSNAIFSGTSNVSFQAGSTVSFGSGVNGITAVAGNSSTLFATTAFVQNAISSSGPWLPVNNPNYTGIMLATAVASGLGPGTTQPELVLPMSAGGSAASQLWFGGTASGNVASGAPAGAIGSVVSGVPANSLLLSAGAVLSGSGFSPSGATGANAEMILLGQALGQPPAMPAIDFYLNSNLAPPASFTPIQVAALSTATNQPAPWSGLFSLVLTATNQPSSSANLIQATANGNWGANISIANTATGTTANSGFGFRNDATTAWMTYTSTGYTAQGPNVLGNVLQLGSTGANGIALFTNASLSPGPPIVLWSGNSMVGAFVNGAAPPNNATNVSPINGLSIPDFAGTGLQVGDAFFASNGRGNSNIATGAWYNGGTGQWVATGTGPYTLINSAGPGVFAVQTAPATTVGANVASWTRQLAVSANGVFVTHLNNDNSMGTPTLSGGTFMSGSNDSFGYILSSAWPVVMTFSRPWAGNPACVATTAAGVAAVMFTNAQNNNSIQFNCNTWGGAACTGLWFSYHCGNTG